MSDLAIRVENLSKRYRIGQGRPHDTLRDQVMDGLRSLFNLNGHRSAVPGPRSSVSGDPSTFWALKDVSFEVRQGEVVGIIGRNGAGKSTLLKILSRITEPTSGRAEIHGRVGSLLEVGTGFHPELSGRENIYLNGAVLGMKKAELDRKFDEIVAFSEIEKFIDTPVKHYSSGMYVRLAFAVAAHLEPEILIVDEVLAVGDAAFQKKCLGKMGEVARGGRTVLLVSHNMASIQNLCNQVVLIVRGSNEYVGRTAEGIRRYLDGTERPVSGEIDLSRHPSRRPGCLPILKAAKLLDTVGNTKARFLCGETMTVELHCDPITRIAHPEFGIGVDDWTGSRIFSVATYLSSARLPALQTPCKVTCCLDELPLAPGRYTLSLSVGTHHDTLMDALDNAVTFEVEGSDFYGNGRIDAELGHVLVRSQWAVRC